MRILYLLRHAKSSWANSATPDFERRLDQRGTSDAKRMAKHMDRLEGGIDLVLCSPSNRTRETLETLQSAWNHNPSVIIDDSLYGTDKDSVRNTIREVGEPTKSLLIIGHNPWIQELAYELSPECHAKATIAEKYPTCSLVRLVFDLDSWNIRGTIARSVELTTPKDLHE